MVQDDQQCELTVVSPFFNEDGCVDEYFRRTLKVLDEMAIDYEIVAVNDGSTDKTPQLLSAVKRDNPQVRICELARNSGQWAAISAGFAASRGRYVIVMDADLQHAPEEIPVLYHKILEGYDLVSGARVGRQESLFLRRIPSLAANWFLRSATGCPTRDMGGFKALRGDIARKLRLNAGQHRLLPALVWLIGGSVAEAPISAPNRFAGQSKYGLKRAVDVLFDILLLWFQFSFKSRPIYLIGRICVAITLTSVVILGYVLFERIAYGIALTSRPAFFFGLLLPMVAFVAFGFGVVLELISDIRHRVNNTRPYVSREK